MSEILNVWFESVGGLLLAMMITSTVICSVAWILTRGLRQRISAADRFAIWRLAVVLLIVLPLGILGLPKIPLGWMASVPVAANADNEILAPFTSQANVFDEPVSVLPSGLETTPLVREPVSNRQKSPNLTAAPPAEPITTVPQVRPNVEVADQPSFTDRWPDVTWIVVAVTAWAIGLILMALRLAISWFHTSRIARQSRPFPRMREWQPPPILLSEDIGTPITVGLRNPKVLMPSVSQTWSRQRLRMVVKHEAAHVKRYDLWWHSLVLLVRAVYWFQPLLWLAARQMQLEREKACDDMVLAQGEEPADYASVLLGIAAELAGRKRSLIAVPIARKPIERRLTTILSPLTPRTPANLPARLTTILCFAGLVCSLCAVRPFDQPLAKQKQESEATVSSPEREEDNSKQTESISQQAASTLRLPKELNGVVVDVNGKPVSNAKVKLRARRIDAATRSIDESCDVTFPATTTNEKGEFTISPVDVEMETTRIQVSGNITAEGYLDRYYSHAFTSADRKQKLDVATLIPARRISGSLVASDNSAVAPKSASVRFGAMGYEKGRSTWFSKFIACDEQGRFEASVPANATVEMITSSENCAGRRVNIPADTDDLGDVVMSENGTVVSGAVFDKNGDPVPEVVVEIYSMEYENSQLFQEASFILPIEHRILTGMDGQFEFPPMTGQCRLFLSKGGRNLQGETIRSVENRPIVLPVILDLKPGEQTREIELVEAPSFTVSGRMQFADGSPAAAVPVKGQVMFDGRGERISQTKTDSDGNYRIRLPISDNSTLITGGHIFAPSGEWNWSYPQLVGGPGVSIQHDARMVNIQAGNRSGIDGVNWEVRPRDEPDVPQRQQDERSEEEQAANPLPTMTLPSPMTGKVLDHEKEPVPNAKVTLAFSTYLEIPGKETSSSDLVFTTTTDEHGYYEIDASSEERIGNHYAGRGFVEAEGKPTVLIPYIPVARDGKLDMPVAIFPEGRRITGRVVVDANIETSRITVRGVGRSLHRSVLSEPGGQMPHWYNQAVPCGRSGQFELWIPKGFRVALGILSDQHAGHQLIVPDDQNDLGEIRLDSGTLIEGAVVDADNRPVAGVYVNARETKSLSARAAGRSNNYRLVSYSVKTDEHGRYELPPIGGTCQVTVASFGHDRNGNILRGDRRPPLIKPQIIEPGKPSELTVNLQESETVTIRGKVTWPDGTAASGVNASVSWNEEIVVSLNAATTDENGNYELTVVTDPNGGRLQLLLRGRSPEGSRQHHYPNPENHDAIQSKSTGSIIFGPLTTSTEDVNWVLRPKPRRPAAAVRGEIDPEASKKLADIGTRYRTQLMAFDEAIANASGEEEVTAMVLDQSPNEMFADEMLELEQEFRGSRAGVILLSRLIGARSYLETHGLDTSDSRYIRGRKKAVKLIQQHYMKHADADLLVNLLQYRYEDEEFQKSLLRMEQETPHDHVRAVIKFRRCEFLADIIESRQMLDAGTFAIERARPGYVDYVRSRDIDHLRKQLRENVKQLSQHYFHVKERSWSLKLPGLELELAERAADPSPYVSKSRAILFECENLLSGSSMPELEGKDVDGKPFWLSDMRGKVVVLYFASKWFCDDDDRNMLKQSHELMKRFGDRPFEIVTVLQDRKLEAAKQFVNEQNITWQTVWDEGRTIGERWNQTSYPGKTLVIDHKGIIRGRYRHDADLGDSIQSLLDENAADR